MSKHKQKIKTLTFFFLFYLCFNLTALHAVKGHFTNQVDSWSPYDGPHAPVTFTRFEGDPDPASQDLSRVSVTTQGK